MKSESFEDILNHAKRIEFRQKYRKDNIQLVVAGLIIALVNFLVMEFSFLSNKETLWETFSWWFVSHLMAMPMMALLFSLGIALIPYSDWKYEHRLFRMTWILSIIFLGLILVFMILGIMEYRSISS